jgi:hypothetical protein
MWLPIRQVGQSPAVAQRDVVRLLEVDPDLGEDLTPEEFSQAERELPVRVVRIPTGTWDVEQTWAEAGATTGLLIIEGLAMRDIDLGRRSSTELLGSGDLARPWHADAVIEGLPLVMRTSVMKELTLAVLDRRFLVTAARWPPVVDAIIGRAMRRARWLAVRLVVNQLVRLEDRLIVMLWALAERWGRVTPDGVILRVDLTHSTLARLVGARRPSVTSALGVLSREDLVVRTDQGWLLKGDPSKIIEPLATGGQLTSGGSVSSAT